jgi:hypothetical protein
MFPDMGDRETFEQTLKITNISQGLVVVGPCHHGPLKLKHWKR